jgi:hypothetical protein
MSTAGSNPKSKLESNLKFIPIFILGFRRDDLCDFSIIQEVRLIHMWSTDNSEVGSWLIIVFSFFDQVIVLSYDSHTSVAIIGDTDE